MTALGIALSGGRAARRGDRAAVGGGEGAPRRRLGPRRPGDGAAGRRTGSRTRSPASRMRCASIRESAQAYCGLGLAYQRTRALAGGGGGVPDRRSSSRPTSRRPVQPRPRARRRSASHEEARQRAAARGRAGTRRHGDPDALQSLLAPEQPADAADASPRASAATSRASRCPRCSSSCACRTRPARWSSPRRRGAAIVRLVRGQVTERVRPRREAAGRDAGRARNHHRRRPRRRAGAAAAGRRRKRGVARGAAAARAPGEPRALTRAVFEQVLDALGEMLSWKEGAFSFHPGSDRELPAISFDVQNVMLELMRVDGRTQGKALPLEEGDDRRPKVPPSTRP